MRTTIVAILCAGLLAAVPATAAAGSFAFHVAVNTSPLVGDPSAPFSLDFALIDGSGTLAAPNTVLVNNFTFSGGSAVGMPTLLGGASGSLSAGISLTDGANFLNEIFQPFVAGSALGFDVYLTINVDPGAPDAFSFAILDKNLLNLTTTGLGDTLLLANIDKASLRLGDLQKFSTTSPAGVTVSVTDLPEPGSLVLLGTGIVAFGTRRGRARR
jgi:hypothetical protein